MGSKTALTQHPQKCEHTVHVTSVRIRIQTLFLFFFCQNIVRNNIICEGTVESFFKVDERLIFFCILKSLKFRYRTRIQNSKMPLPDLDPGLN